MTFITINQERFHYRFDGPSEAPLLILSNSLGTNLSMWNSQIPAFAEQFRVLRYDTRGHGQSIVSPGPYSVEQLSRDVVAMLDLLNISRVHFCGLSLGGMIGIWLGVHAPARLHRLILCNTAAKIGTAEVWNARIATVHEKGMSAISPVVLERWFTKSFAAREPRLMDDLLGMLNACDPVGYAAACAAVRDMDQCESLPRVAVPTLVIAGAQDPVIPPSEGKLLAERISGAEYAELDAAHLSNVEAAPAFTMRVLAFLAKGETH
jgi:3-oxoadipate enol-lactonase